MGLNGEWVKYLHRLGKVHRVDQFINALIPKVVAEYQQSSVDSIRLRKLRIIMTFKRRITVFESEQKMSRIHAHCLKIAQNVAYEFSNFGISHQFLTY